MIANNTELQAAQERIAFFYRVLSNMRVQARSSEEYRLYYNSYLVELERMHAEVLEYLRHHAGEAVPAEAA